MAQIKLRDELVEDPNEKDAYYKVTVVLNGSTSGSATLPDIGKVNVAKETHRYPEQHTSFAWKVVK